MNPGAETDEGVSAVPLVHAVFCVDCESISNSPHDACTICGSHSLIGLFRLLGGTLGSQKAPSSDAKTSTYNLELTVKMRAIPANELSRALQAISRLADVDSDLECLHINLESVFAREDALKAA